MVFRKTQGPPAFYGHPEMCLRGGAARQWFACTKETLPTDNMYDQEMCQTWGYPCIRIDRSYEVELPE